MAVHEGAGLIDVSTREADGARPGRRRLPQPALPQPVRQSEAGPDPLRGARRRRRADHRRRHHLPARRAVFYVTTTSSGADAVEAWFAWWLAEWDLDVHLTDVSQGLAAFNLAGPSSRESSPGLTDLDCSNDAFAYLDGKRAHVAGVPCLLLRIGFVGELGYELHCPGSLAEDLWDALIEAGEPHGIRPFGLEPQRVLRLQKLHILVGQDTDAESNPLEAAMPWIVKLDKDQDFIGRWALELVQERETTTSWSASRWPTGQCRPGGRRRGHRRRQPVGRVTSSRFSPKLERTIGMAWVPAELGEDGTAITLADNGRRLSAQVQTAPFYDPDQERLREMSFEFLAPDAAQAPAATRPAQRSPIEWAHRDAGPAWASAPAGGWSSTTAPAREAAACRDSVGVADLSAASASSSSRPTPDRRVDRLGARRRRRAGARAGDAARRGPGGARSQPGA